MAKIDETDRRTCWERGVFANDVTSQGNSNGIWPRPSRAAEHRTHIFLSDFPHFKLNPEENRIWKNKEVPQEQRSRFTFYLTSFDDQVIYDHLQHDPEVEFRAILSYELTSWNSITMPNWFPYRPLGPFCSRYQWGKFAKFPFDHALALIKRWS